MAEVAPTGIVSKAQGNMRTLLSESAAFQTWVGAANATEALDSIYLIEGPAVSASRPLAVIGPGDKFSMDAIAGGVISEYWHSGVVQIWFEDDVADALNEPDAWFTFTNTMGAILADLVNPTDTDSVMNITQIEQIFGPARTAEEERQTGIDVMNTAYDFTWQTG